MPHSKTTQTRIHVEDYTVVNRLAYDSRRTMAEVLCDAVALYAAVVAKATPADGNDETAEEKARVAVG